MTRPLARGLRESKGSLTYRWLERIENRVEIGADEVFPSEDTLDHIPLLIDAIADFLENPAEEGTAADEVMAKAAELGQMRFEQGFSTYQVLKAQDTAIELVVAEPLPDVEVLDAEVEHCLVVYLTNALRHCRDVDGECRVEVSGRVDQGGDVVVSVRNTGQPIEAADDITTLADGDTREDVGPPGRRGVGLRFARDLIDSLGGRTWAEPASDPAGSVFALAIPDPSRDDG